MTTAFDADVMPVHDFSQADVIVSLGADFIDSGPGRLAYARDFAERRRVLNASDDMNRLYQLETSPSVTGTVADHRIALTPSAIAAAADRTYVSVEQIVSNPQIRADPRATSIAGADGVTRLPFGAHPSGSHGYYPADAEHISAYAAAAGEWLRSGDRSALDRFFDTYIHEPADHVEYLEKVGLRHLLSLTEFGV